MTTAMSFPVDDWQFWVATLAGLVAVWWLTKGLIPWGRILGRTSARRARSRKVTLTISAPGRDPNQPPNE